MSERSSTSWGIDGHPDPNIQNESTPAATNAGPGAEKANEYRKVHGNEPCPGESCATHGGKIATRQVAMVILPD